MLFLFSMFVTFETKQDQFCVSFRFVPTEAARVTFMTHFLKRKRLLVAVQCLDFCVPYLRSVTKNIIRNDRHFKIERATQRVKLCNDEVNHASVLK